jgi:Na+/melibiose symporter-like transporter
MTSRSQTTATSSSQRRTDGGGTASPAARRGSRSSLLAAFRVLRHRQFRRLWIGLVVSTSGTFVRILAASILIFQQTGSAAWVGVLNFLGFLPIVFLSLPGGHVVDRRGSKAVLVGAQAFSMMVSSGLAAAAAFQRATPAVLCAGVFLLGCSYSFTKPAAQSLFPALVPADSLTEAIGVNGLQFTLGMVFGPVTASLLLESLGFTAAFAIDASTFVVLLLIALSLPDVRPPEDQRSRKGTWESIGEAVRFVTGNRVLLSLLFGIVTGTAGLEMVKTLMPVFVVEALHLRASTSGYFVGIFGTGTLLGVAAVPAVLGWLGARRTVFVGLVLLGGATLAFSLLRGGWPSSPLLVLAGAGHMMSFTVMSSAFFRLVPEGLRGRVLAIHALSFLGVSPFTALAAGALAGAGGVALSGAVFALAPVAGAALFAWLFRSGHLESTAVPILDSG